MFGLGFTAEVTIAELASEILSLGSVSVVSLLRLGTIMMTNGVADGLRL